MLRKVLFEQGPCMKNCSNHLHSDQHGMKDEDGKTDKKKVVHAHKHVSISSEQPGYFHILNIKKQWLTHQSHQLQILH